MADCEGDFDIVTFPSGMYDRLVGFDCAGLGGFDVLLRLGDRHQPDFGFVAS